MRLTLLNSVRGFLLAAVCATPPVVGAWASADTDTKTKIDRVKTEMMPLDSGEKKQEEKKNSIEYIEQKGMGPSHATGVETPTFRAGRSVAELCSLYEGKVISFAGVIALVENCKQRVVESSQDFNMLLAEKKLSVVDVESEVVRKIPFGRPFESKPKVVNAEARQKLCEKTNGRYVTSDGESFFYVEKCVRKPFRSFVEFAQHNAEGRPVMALDEHELGALPEGSTIVVPASKESDVLYKVDGDVYWSRLFPPGKVDRLSEDSLKKIEKIDAERSRINKRSEICARYEGKIVSFYSRIYLVEKCLRRPLQDVTLDIQAALTDKFSPQDISAEQYRALPEGEGLSGEHYLKRGSSARSNK